MPFILDYTDPGGSAHPESYWIAGAISYNNLLKTGQIIFQGYHDKDAFDNGDGQLAGSPRLFATTDPALFDQYFQKGQRLYSGLSFQGWLESFAQNEDITDHFFELALVYAPAGVYSAEIGGINKTTLAVIFLDEVTSATDDYLLGITIRVNGSPITPALGAKQTGLNSIWYTIAAVDADDLLDWEYDASVGDLADNAGQLQQSSGLVIVNNQVGTFLRFNVAENSGLLLTL